MTKPIPDLSSFSERIRRDGSAAALHPDTLVGASGPYQVFYMPFSHVEARARLAIVGITPGTKQMELAYNRAGTLLRAGRPEAEVLRAVKSHGAFGGPMRPRLLRMLRHFGFASLLGVGDEADLWGHSAHLLHSTSIVPHAAFANGKMFNGSFEQVLGAPALRECFERDFVPELSRLPPDCVFLALGTTPLAALEHCAARGLIAPSRILGALAHPSGSGGSQVGVYIGERDAASLKDCDPVRHRVPRLLADGERVREAIARLRGADGRPVATPAAATAPATPPRATGVAPRPAPVPAAPEPGAVEADGGNGGLHAFVARGVDAGTRLTPHLHKDGCFVVSPTRFERDYVRVRAGEPLEGYLSRGLSLRMSAAGRAPSLISPGKIHGRACKLAGEG